MNKPHRISDYARKLIDFAKTRKGTLSLSEQVLAIATASLECVPRGIKSEDPEDVVPVMESLISALIAIAELCSQENEAQAAERKK